ncbi:ABC-type glycerol-3-phosphate transport system, substrate-binding protein [Rhizobiales bacterium GAS191]|nr:carbohydrate ABC transporter substrate-binding protein, CUT1 family [Rhizobiales bacterium GAS113]SED56834.1 ABC-type glycerol-3-phosphate transport system, substrate-binding protein [Rhizobiales bacterium GAS191]
MGGLNRRRLLQGSAGGLLAASTRTAWGQSKPEKLVFVGENSLAWKRTLIEEVAPAFEKATGIKIEFTLLPVDAWRARLKAELSAESTGIDLAMLSVQMAGWMSAHLLDHNEVVAKIMARDPSFAWDDFLAGGKVAGTYDGRLAGIPYRLTAQILHYQKELLEKAGFAQAPATFAEFEKAALAVNAPPSRYGFGLMGKQGAGTFTNVVPWLFSAGGRLVDFNTGEIFLNDGRAAAGLQFYADLVLKDKVVPPEAMTWEFDEIIAGAQKDRYAMSVTFSSYGTLFNDPKLSQTGGRWAWATMPGHTEKAQSRSIVDGQFMAISKYSKNADWAMEFIRMACSKEAMLRSMEGGNAPPRGSSLRNPAMVAKLGWPAAAAEAIETGIPISSNPTWDGLELSLRAGVSQALLGQKTAKQALDDVAVEWKRNLRRAGIIK